ncbi:MAG TPA: S1C family serine protease [Bryobacteraceae bacterium]|jgi:S1-C subfamily serine protease|nr:S1C family serine protease [Bryobacteraceae bacterium]
MSNTLTAFSDDVTRAVAAAEPHVVSLDGRRHFYASGMVWRPGVIVTAEHAIAQGDQIAATLPDGTRATATVAGRDSGTDIAVVKVDGLAAPLERRTAGGIRPGALVLTVGRAPEIGTLAAMGIISGVRGTWRTWRGGSIDQYIRLDVGMYPGSSGAAVVDADGHVLGMATTALSRAAGVAIPNATLDRVVDQILSNGHVTRAWLGVGLQPVNLPAHLSGNRAERTGLMIVSLEDGGPAAQSGLLPGDILLGIGGRVVVETDDVQDALEGRAGQNVPFEILRGGEKREVSVKPGERQRRG